MPKLKKTLINYLKKVYPFLTVLALWWLVVHFKLFPEFFLPSPEKTFLLFWEMISEGSLLVFVGVSFANFLKGFFLGSVFALILATLCGFNKAIKDFFYPLINAIYPIPIIAWVPFTLLWFGFSSASIISLVFLASFFYIFYNTLAGIENINPTYIKVAKNLGLKHWNYYKEVVIFGTFHFILPGIKLAVGAAWRVLIGAEMLALTSKGLGWFIWRGKEFYRYDQVLVGIITIALIGLALEKLILQNIEKATLQKWY